MKKAILICIGALLTSSIMAQDLFQVRESEVSFYSDSPLEKIEAVNTKNKSFFKKSTKTVAIVITIVNFKFEEPLMEEHFNENYMESEKFPTATFKGEINEDIDFSKDGTYDASATGKLTLHGVEQERTIKGKITIKGDEIIGL